MTVVKKAQLNSKDVKVILESDCNGEEVNAGAKKHKCERVKNLSAKSTSECIESNSHTKKSKGIEQTENGIKICEGTNIEDCNVRKKRKYIKKAIEATFANSSGEESLGDKIVTKTKVKTQESCEKNFNLKDETTVEKVKTQSLSNNLNVEDPINQKKELQNELEKTGDFKERAVLELEKGVLIAVRVLIGMMNDETATNALKVDCAKEILTRLYGKTFEKTNETCEIELSQELKEYCE